MNHENMKMTEVGWIPKDWECKSFGKVLKIGHGKDYKHLQFGPIPVYGTGGYMTSVNDYLYDGESACIGRKGTINRPIFLNGKFWTVDTLFYTHSFKDTFPKFVFYAFQQIDWLSYNEATGVPSLTAQKIEEIECAFPPISEQRLIAQVLSDTDSLIASLSRTIEKKRLVKQGAMQQLLTGKTRLKGFSGEWVEKELGKCADIYRGGSPRPIESFITTLPDGLNWIKIGDVANNAKYINKTAERIIPEGEKHSRFVRNGDLLLSNSMSFGRPYILRTDGCIHDGWLVIQNYKDEWVTDFLYYLLCSENVLKQYEVLAAGSGVKNLNKAIVSNVVLRYPVDLNEQFAIANILTTMDNEITSLEAELQKYKALKQGMMQKLLTGEIRLPICQTTE